MAELLTPMPMGTEDAADEAFDADDTAAVRASVQQTPAKIEKRPVFAGLEADELILIVLIFLLWTQNADAELIAVLAFLLIIGL